MNTFNIQLRIELDSSVSEEPVFLLISEHSFEVVVLNCREVDSVGVSGCYFSYFLICSRGRKLHVRLIKNTNVVIFPAQLISRTIN